MGDMNTKVGDGIIDEELANGKYLGRIRMVIDVCTESVWGKR